MARIRTVKPDFFRHEGLYELEVETGLPIRVAFAGLFTVADREGRFRWRPKELKLDILPFDDLDFEWVMAALLGDGFISKYEVDGAIYGHIPTFKRHQVVNARESQSRLPAPADGLAVPVVRSRVIPAKIREHMLARARICAHCESTENIQFDHIVPFSLGGTHELDNLQYLCRACNVAKGNKSDEEAKARARTVAHVHARGEGKGRERKGKEGTLPRVAREGETPTGLARASTVEPKTPNEKAHAFIATYARAYAARFPNGRPEDLNDGKTRGQIMAWIKDYPLERACQLVQVYLQLDTKWFSTKGYDFLTFRNNLNTIGRALDSGTDPGGSTVNWDAIFAKGGQAVAVRA